MNELIEMADDVNLYVTTNVDKHTDLGIKELKKIEMYLRKSYIMWRTFTDMHQGKYSDESEVPDDEEWIKKLNGALVRDFRYVKMRDGLDDYEI